MQSATESIRGWFPEIPDDRWEKLDELCRLFREWNARINLVSRKDIEAFEVHHLAHALALVKVAKFQPGMRVLDVGTGGGLPGLPLAIVYPEVRFFLCDSVAKKVRAVDDMVQQLGLKNVQAVNKRAETLESRWEFVLGRAVTSLPKFLGWIGKNIRCGGDPEQPNGVFYWKGTLYQEELESIGVQPFQVHDLGQLLAEPYFAEKFIIHLKGEDVRHFKDEEQ